MTEGPGDRMAQILCLVRRVDVISRGPCQGLEVIVF